MSITNLLVISEESKADGKYAYLEEAGTDDLPVFDLIPEFTFEEKQEYAVLKSSFNTGMVLRRSVITTKTRVFTLRWKNANKVENDRLVELYRSRRGGAAALWFKPVNSDTYVRVRFREDSFTHNRKSYDKYFVRFDFIELL